jgi:predicted Zn-dependent protease
MLKRIRGQIERLMGAGATYADARWYPFEDADHLTMWNGNLKKAVASRESGIGVRVLYRGAWGFSASSDTGGLEALIDKGVLVGAVTGRQMVVEANTKAGRQIFQGSGGANRATAFYRVPIERMTNINIDPGNDGALDDIIRSTEN